ncbi:hypothetical protein AKJ42_00595 [candidate division MSBL1 archaeon SCGC-AAA261C02]|uniref:Uncharacterized protein n=1 Tax=candidate division MSBL1 archaeon SCGC-AAA261C02 TaxID=1698272 RepID=A0A133V1Y2_9EURY|nr:hypothetical protein AKJ42_00595 [candidate division MSBL1 archaeon SCGC-AAA261C02]
MDNVVCGYTRFKEKYQETFELLLEKGWFVRSVECFGHKENLDFPEGFKDELDRIHKEKILEIDRLKEKYPDAEIRVEGESIEEKEEEPVIEVVEGEENE